MARHSFSAVILAAGKATRFKSERSKLLHRLLGRPLGEYALRAVLALEPERSYMIIGHDAEEARKTFARPGLTFIEQKEQLGTGHALMIARAELERCSSPTLVVMVGDAPLLRTETLAHLIQAHEKARAAATVLSVRLGDPSGYGRVVRSGQRVRAIVEEKAATAAQKKIREINSGILCFSRPRLLKHLGKLSAGNPQKEYLLTEIVEILSRQHEKVSAVSASDPQEVLGVNNRAELARIERTLRLAKLDRLMLDGVTVADPQVTYVEEGVEVGADTVLEPGVSLRGATRIGRNCQIQMCSTVADSILGDRVTVRQSSLIVGCEVSSDAVIGPFAHLRDGAVIESNARIGNFVEVKKSRVGRGTKASHLTYLGDATLGSNVNVGAGTVTCNYDGEKKNPTLIEDGCFIGSGSMLVAPVRIGKGSYVAAGSTITEDVPPESLGMGRARQVNKEGWVRTRAKAKPELGISVTVREVDSVAVFEVSGRLTLGRAAEYFRERIQERVARGSKNVIVSFAHVVYIDSAGLGGLVAAMTTLRAAGGQLKLTSMPAEILRIFEAANLDRAFDIHPHEAAALASFGASQHA